MSKIEWTDVTWNPVTGCTKISSGCKNCYAERMSKRLAGRAGYPKENPFKVTFHNNKLRQPDSWKKPCRVFVCSMGDLYHKDINPLWRRFILNTIERCPQHTFILLTKRPQQMVEDFLDNTLFCNVNPDNEFVPVIPKNLWLGVSVENQKTLLERVPSLCQIKNASPETVTFISYEPALGPINIYPDGDYDENTGKRLKIPFFAFLDWVICGCESGPHARYMDLGWARSLRDQCVEMKIPFFLKQIKINKTLVKMPELGGRVWDQIPK